MSRKLPPSPPNDPELIKLAWAMRTMAQEAGIKWEQYLLLVGELQEHQRLFYSLKERKAQRNA